MTQKTDHPLNLNGSMSTAASAAGAGATIEQKPAAKPQTAPNPEATPKAKRRTFSAVYKRRILQEAERCDQHGQIGALLRREGLYSSQLTDWQRQEAAGKLAGTKSSKRGRPAKQTAEEKKINLLQRGKRTVAKETPSRRVNH